MASILAKILDGKITSEDLTDPHETLRNEDVKGEEEKLEQCNIAELVPFLLNYLREKASHHLTPRQSAAITPKKTSVSQAKRANSASEQTQHAAKNSRGNLFPSQKTPSPSPVTPLSQSRRDKLHEYRSSPSSSPHVRRKSPKAHGSDRDRQSQLVTQPKLNIDDPDDFPPMGSASKKVTPSRRITPTQVKSDGKKGKVSPAFSSSPFSSPHTVLESYGSPASLQEERNMLKLERARKKNKGDFTWGNRTSPSPQASVRSPLPHVLGDFIVSPPKQSTTSDHLEKSHSKPNDSLLSTPSPCKDPSGETCSDNAATGATSPQQFEEETHKEKAQFIQVDKDKVVFHHKLDALAKVYSRCILANLVPNVTAELYFVMQLLTARGIVSEQQQDSENGKLGEIHSQNILGSIHNCAYFAVAVLQEIQRLILLLDKETLHLLADNPRIADFSPSLKETFLQQYKAYSVTKVSQVNFIKSPLGGVPFSVERDNKQNFPTERAFHNFNKQRDVFYELVRKWEDSHSATGWNMEEHMGDRIRALVNQKPEVANYSHFARLFKSQLLQMCEEEKNGSDFRSSSMLSNLQKSNPEKFQRLQERFITPLSTSGPCPSPSFSNVQEFFKGFIQSAASHSFNQHLIDLLIVKITEIDDKEFPLLDIEVSEKDLSIQNKELKHDFSGCLMNVRILAKFLGFLLFQPYYGAETTSQVITTETLKIRNRIPIQFDILSYLKKAWYSGRLVLTIPWAVEYLSMMDPLAPHLDYFSGVLYWLQIIYREIAAQSAKNDLNHSRLLLVSCLGWFFEIPVIPVSFFFKSLTDSKQPIDEDLKSTSSDVKVSLDSIGIVDQGILYSCCPYLGEIRSVLVEAAAGLSGRAGPVKKITPVSAGEPARISSSQRQLQLQLEENFFRIQPDFLKRLSDFTVERLCSNIISHVKGNIIPSLLGRGVQRIQEFLDNEFSGNTNTDQAKEKCRPHVLKIIHSVTDDGVKAALETVESSKQKSLSAFESLCPQEMNSKVITTAANITTRLIKEKTSDWINTCLPNIMEEGLFVQFDKIANSILNSKSKEPRIRDSQSDANTKQIPENVCEVKAKCCKQPGGCLPESATPAMKVKALQAVLSEQSKLLAMQSPSEITPEVVAAVVALESTLISEGQSYAKEMALIGQITVELVFILVCRTAYGVTVVETNCTKNSCGILDKLTKLWTRLKERHIEVPFERLLSNPHVNLIMTIDNRKVVFEALQALFLSLIRKHLIYSHEVEQWYISALGWATDKGTAVELCTTSCSLVLAYHEARNRNGSGDESHKTVHQAEFSLLLAALIQRFPHNSSVSSLLSECVKNNPGVIVISDDSAIN